MKFPNCVRSEASGYLLKEGKKEAPGVWRCDGYKVISLCGKETGEPDTNDLCVFLYVHVGNDLQRPHG